MTDIALVYAGVINLITFITYGVDKNKAKRHVWRIPERVLILLAVLGGSIGALLGMRVFHHKTKKAKFAVGVPVIFVIQAVLVIYVMKYYLYV